MTPIVATTVDERAEAPGGALAELYARHAPGAVRLAFLVTGDREAAQDIAQDAFIKVAGRFRHLRFPDAFDAYLRRTVINLCTSRFRHARVSASTSSASAPACRRPPARRMSRRTTR